MKLNNNLIVFDLETTNCENHAIIEIGATLVTKDFKIGPTFKRFVYPDFPVSKFVEDLTGYSAEKLNIADKFPIVARAFESWITELCGNIKNVRLAAWGNYFDVNVLRTQYQRHGLDFPFSGTCIDVKSIGFVYLAMSGGRTDSFSVQKMCENLGIKLPEGCQYHNADTDAFQTAHIFIECMQKMSGGVWLDKRYVEVK